MSPPRVLVIGGPTAAGKTAVAVEVAARFGADVLCADAMTVYRGLDIGTAKPSMAERRGVPHHALDVVEPTRCWRRGAGWWWREGRACTSAR